MMLEMDKSLGIGIPRLIHYFISKKNICRCQVFFFPDQKNSPIRIHPKRCTVIPAYHAETGYYKIDQYVLGSKTHKYASNV